MIYLIRWNNLYVSYGQPDDGVNQARCRLFCTKALSEFRLPSCRDALLLHCKRSNYQAAIWRKAWLGKIGVPLPHGHGWVLENNALSLRWTTQEEAPPKLMPNYSCKCKKNQCANNQCSCFVNNVSCTELCSCLVCKNDDPSLVKVELLNDVSDDKDVND